MTKPIPAGYHSVTASLTIKDCGKAISFYEKAFGAETLDVFPSPVGGGIMHATIQIGDSIIMMGDENPSFGCKSAETLGTSPVSLYLYVRNVDESFKRAVAAGATVEMSVEEMFWGDRAGSLKDPFGYSWMIATHTRDLKPDEIRAEAEAFFTSRDPKKT